MNYHRERFRKLTFRALALRQSEYPVTKVKRGKQNNCNAMERKQKKTGIMQIDN